MDSCRVCKQMGETQNPGFKVLLHHIEHQIKYPQQEIVMWLLILVHSAAWRMAAKTSNTARALVVKGAKRGNSNERRDCGTCHVIDGVVGRAINLILGDYVLNILYFFFVNEILFPCASCCKKDFIDRQKCSIILYIRNHRRMKCRVIH